MTIKGIIRKLKKTGDPVLISYAGIMEHMENKGFFRRYTDTIESAKYGEIESMLTRISEVVNPEYGVETGQVLRAAFIGFAMNTNGKRKSRNKNK